MKKTIFTLCAVIAALTGCSLDSIPKEELCPGPGMDADNIVVYIYQNGIKEEDILHSERCPEYAPVCRQFTYDSENSGKFFCMENCAKQYCDKCKKNEHMIECNGRCILPGDDCKDEEEPARCIEDCIDKHTRMVCSADQTTYKREICASDEECQEGECIKIDAPEKPVCNSGETRCVDAVTIQTCHEEGKWNEPEQCPEGQKCDATKKTCIPDEPEQIECESDAIKCADNTSYFVCVNGHWSSEITSCGDGRFCDAVNHQCKEGCIADTKRCSEDKSELQHCVNGNWEKLYTCTDGKLCFDDACNDIECTPGETYCDDTVKKPQVYTCDEKGKKDKIIDTCKTKCNSAHTACMVCMENEMQCTDIGTLQVCEGGEWADLSECGAGMCDAESKRPGCNCTAESVDQKADMRCSSDASSVEICVENKHNNINYRGWKEQTSCGAPGMCATSGDNGAACKCKENDYQCQDHTLLQCQSGILTSVKECSSTESCNAEKKDCVCKNGSRRCSNNDVEKCVSGEWQKEKSCSGNQYCNDTAGGVCISRDVCTDGETDCSVTSLMKCSHGLFEQEKECSCVGGECYNSGQLQELCKYNPSLRWCIGSGGFTGCSMVPELCNMFDEHCFGGICQKSACSEYSRACSGSKLQGCRAGQYVVLVDCSDYGMDCDKDENKCVPK